LALALTFSAFTAEYELYTEQIRDERGCRMGKGDRRSRRGKIWRGTTGRRRGKKKPPPVAARGAVIVEPAAPDKKSKPAGKTTKSA